MELLPASPELIMSQTVIAYLCGTLIIVAALTPPAIFLLDSLAH
jgi:hypothetical protein